MGELLQLTETTIATRYSEGMESRARQLAARCGSAHEHLQGLFGVAPEVTLFVLARPDWAEHANFPIYAMPHYRNARMIVGAEPGDFWRSMADIVEKAHPDRRAELAATYGVIDGRTDLTRLFDLVVVHELGHAFQYEGRVSFPRLWLSELFASLCMYSHVMANEPSELPALELIHELLLTAAHPFQHNTLADFERLYTGVGAENYSWYQFKLSGYAHALLEKSGDEALRRLWRTFRLVDDELASRLRNDVDPLIAQLMTHWDR